MAGQKKDRIDQRLCYGPAEAEDEIKEQEHGRPEQEVHQYAVA